MTTRHTLADRVGAATGAAYVLLILVGNQVAEGNNSDSHPSGAADLADLATRTTRETIGETMEVLGFLAFMFFLGWLVHQLRSRGGAAGWLAGVAAIAGITELAVKIGSVLPLAAGELDHRDISPSTARVLVDMNGAGFVITFLPAGILMIALGAAVLCSGYLGRLAGWSAITIGVLGVVLTLATSMDPLDTNPLPFLAGLLWILVVAIRLAVKAPRAATGVAPAAAPSPVAA